MANDIEQSLEYMPEGEGNIVERVGFGIASFVNPGNGALELELPAIQLKFWRMEAMVADEDGQVTRPDEEDLETISFLLTEGALVEMFATVSESAPELARIGMIPQEWEDEMRKRGGDTP